MIFRDVTLGVPKPKRLYVVLSPKLSVKYDSTIKVVMVYDLKNIFYLDGSASTDQSTEC